MESPRSKVTDDSFCPCFSALKCYWKELSPYAARDTDSFCICLFAIIAVTYQPTPDCVVLQDSLSSLITPVS